MYGYIQNRSKIRYNESIIACTITAWRCLKWRLREPVADNRSQQPIKCFSPLRFITLPNFCSRILRLKCSCPYSDGDLCTISELLKTFRRTKVLLDADAPHVTIGFWGERIDIWKVTFKAEAFNDCAPLLADDLHRYAQVCGTRFARSFGNESIKPGESMRGKTPVKAIETHDEIMKDSGLVATNSERNNNIQMNTGEAGVINGNIASSLNQRDEIGAEVVLKFEFPIDFPSRPPFVSVWRPRFMFHTGHVTIGGSICAQVRCGSCYCSLALRERKVSRPFGPSDIARLLLSVHVHQNSSLLLSILTYHAHHSSIHPLLHTTWPHISSALT